MRDFLCFVLIAFVASVYMFKRFDRIREDKKGQRREDLNEFRQQYLQQFVKPKEEKDEDQ